MTSLWGSFAEVESSRTSLASRTHFEVLGLGLESQVLGLEASKVLENWPVLGLRTALFFDLLKFRGALEKFLENVFFCGDRLKHFCEDLFFFGEHLCLCPWPRAFLSLASRVSVLGKAVLGLGFFLCPWPWPRVLDSTSSLLSLSLWGVLLSIAGHQLLHINVTQQSVMLACLYKFVAK